MAGGRRFYLCFVGCFFAHLLATCGQGLAGEVQALWTPTEPSEGSVHLVQTQLPGTARLGVFGPEGSATVDPPGNLRFFGLLSYHIEQEKCWQEPIGPAPVAGCNEAGLSVSNLPLFTPTRGQYDPTMARLLGSCRTKQDVIALLSRGPGGLDGQSRGFGIAAAYAVLSVTEASMLEYVRSDNRLEWALREFVLEPDRQGDPQRAGRAEMIFRRAGAGPGPADRAGICLVKDFDSVLDKTAFGRGPKKQDSDPWLPITPGNELEIPAIVKRLRKLHRDSENMGDTKGEAAILFHRYRGQGDLMTAWVLMGPAEYSIALPLWPGTLKSSDPAQPILPEAFSAILPERSIALQAAKLCRRGTPARLIDRNTQPFQQRIFSCVETRLLPFWHKALLDPEVEARIVLSQMLAVQNRFATDALSLLSSCTRLGTVGNAPPEAEIRTYEMEGLRVSLTGRIHDKEDASKVEYLWDYGDGVTGRRGRHTYPRAGRYLVRLTVTDRHGVSVSDFQPIVARGYPPVRNGERPVDALRRHRRVRPRRVVIAGNAGRAGNGRRFPDVPLVAALAVGLLLLMGAASSWRIQRLRAGKGNGPVRLRLR